MEVQVSRRYRGGVPEKDKNIYSFNTVSKTIIEKSGEITAVKYYLHGFEGDDCTLTWDDSSMTLYVDGVDFGLWYRGTLAVLNSTSIQIDASGIGIWYIYYNAENELMASQDEWDLNWDNPVAQIEWDGDSGIMTDNRYSAFNLSHILISRMSEEEQHWGRQISLDVTNFSKNLSQADDTVQKAMETIDQLASTITSAYIAYVSQTGTNAPTATEVLNQIGSPVWSRVSTGTYRLTLTGAFPANKTCPIDDCMMDQVGNYYTLNRISADVMELKTYAYTNISVLADGVLSNRYIAIEIYP